MARTHELGDGRDANTGKFVSGNPGGGRPKKLVEESYRRLFSKAVTLKDWELIIKKAVRDAKKGSAPARNFLASWLCGTPEQYHMMKVKMASEEEGMVSGNPYEDMSDGELKALAKKMLGVAIGGDGEDPGPIATAPTPPPPEIRRMKAVRRVE